MDMGRYHSRKWRYHLWLIVDREGIPSGFSKTREGCLDRSFGSCWKDVWPELEAAGYVCKRMRLVDATLSAQAGAPAGVGVEAEACRYLENLLILLAAKHYPDVPQFKPLSGDLVGMLTQIDNMTTGLTRHAAQSGVSPAGVGDGLRAGLEEALRIVEAVPATVNEPRVFPKHEDLTSGGRSVIVPAQTIMITRQTDKKDLVAALRARLATPNGSEG